MQPQLTLSATPPLPLAELEETLEPSWFEPPTWQVGTWSPERGSNLPKASQSKLVTEPEF